MGNTDLKDGHATPKFWVFVNFISHIYVNCKNHLICYIIGHDYHGHYLHAGGLIVNNYVREIKVREVNVIRE